MLPLDCVVKGTVAWGWPASILWQQCELSASIHSFHLTSRSKGHAPLEGKKDFLLPATHYKVIHLHWVCCFYLGIMLDSCCAIGCTNCTGDKPGLCFYRIPSDKENIETELPLTVSPCDTRISTISHFLYISRWKGNAKQVAKQML